MPHTTKEITRVFRKLLHSHLSPPPTHNLPQSHTHTQGRQALHTHMRQILHAGTPWHFCPAVTLPQRLCGACAHASMHACTHALSLPLCLPIPKPPRCVRGHARARSQKSLRLHELTRHGPSHDMQRAASNACSERNVANPQEMVICAVQ